VKLRQISVLSNHVFTEWDNFIVELASGEIVEKRIPGGREQDVKIF
jgi:hypothetical protein